MRGKGEGRRLLIATSMLLRLTGLLLRRSFVLFVLWWDFGVHGVHDAWANRLRVPTPVTIWQVQQLSILTRYAVIFDREI